MGHGQQETGSCLAPSKPTEVGPAEKQDETFRDYEVSETATAERRATLDRVRMHYIMMHGQQTYDFVLQKKADYTLLDKAEWTIEEALARVNYVDTSDPDFDDNNLFHFFQTAEAAKKLFPDERWFHFAAFIHDLGKILFLWGEPDWCIGGDTFPVGCAFEPTNVYPETFKPNPDNDHPVYSTKLGVYKENCGLHNLNFAWGHDEYIYMVIKAADLANGWNLDPRIYYILRFHSFYPWHTHGGYKQFENEEDRENLPWVQQFQKCDLYTKDGVNLPDTETMMRDYYTDLINEFCPGKLRW